MNDTYPAALSIPTNRAVLALNPHVHARSG